MGAVSEQEQLGEFFRQFRVERGLTLKEAAGDWSASLLSRFERGQADISADKAIGLMHRIGLEPQDWLLLPEQPDQFPMTLELAVITNDIAGLEQREEAYFDHQSRSTTMTRLARVLFRAGKHWPEPDFRLSSAEEQLLADILTLPENLTLFENELRAAYLAPASHELLLLLWQRSERMNHNVRKLYRVKLGLSLFLGAVVDHDEDLMATIQPELAAALAEYGELSEYDDVQSLRRLITLLSAWVQKPDQATAAMIDELIADTLASGAVSQARYFTLLYQRAHYGKPYHNPALVDHPSSIAGPLSHAGNVLRGRRLYLQLSRQDIALDNDESTIRRFEEGKTQLSFGNLVRLSGKLAVLPQTLLQSTGLSVKKRLPLHNLWVVRTELTGLLNAGAELSEIQALLHQYQTEHLSDPQPMQAAARFVLQATAQGVLPNIDLDEMATEAHRLLHQFGRANHWGMFEALCAGPIIPYLDDEELSYFADQLRRVMSKQANFLGLEFCYEAVIAVLHRAVDDLPRDEAIRLAAKFKWLWAIDDDDPSHWHVLGTLTIVTAVLQPTPVNQATVHDFLNRAKRTGHGKVAEQLQQAWGNQLPAEVFKE